jgi:hypothetical protein
LDLIVAVRSRSNGQDGLGRLAAAQATGGELGAAAHCRTWPKRPSGA